MLPFWIMNYSLFPPHISKCIVCSGKIAKSSVAQLTAWMEKTLPNFSLPSWRQDIKWEIHFLCLLWFLPSQYSLWQRRRRGSSTSALAPYMIGCGQTLAISINWIFTYPVNLSIQQNKINEKGPLVTLHEIKVNG